MLQEHQRALKVVDPLDADAREAWIATAGRLIHALHHHEQRFAWLAMLSDDLVRRCPLFCLPLAYARLVAAMRVVDLRG
jgi:hypothetical protein